MDKGVHFHDLQVHTSRDRNWSGGERVTEANRIAYAAHLVQPCRDRGLQAIAITDHHDMVTYGAHAGKRMAPQVGLEPTTLRLTAGCSAIELLRSVAVNTSALARGTLRCIFTAIIS